MSKFINKSAIIISILNIIIIESNQLSRGAFHVNLITRSQEQNTSAILQRNLNRTHSYQFDFLLSGGQ